MESKRDASSKREVYVQLMPSAEVKMFTTSSATNIRDLKILSEEKYGIPSDVLILIHNSVVLDDNTTMFDLGASKFQLLDLFIQPLWEKFIHSCLKGENDRVIARVHIKMNQLSSEARAFVAAFIAAHIENSTLFQLMIDSFKKEVIFQTVCLSGRSLLHAAVLGGNINCVITLVINGGWKLLNQADKQREVPLDIAQRMKKEEGLVQILTKYNDMYIDRHWEKDDETIKRNNKGEQLVGDDSGQDERLKGIQEDFSKVGDVVRDVLVSNPPTEGRPEQSAPAIRGHRLLQRRDTPSIKLHTGKSVVTTQRPTQCEVIVENAENHTRSNNNNKRVDQIKLPVINLEGGESPTVSPRLTRRGLLLGVEGRRGRLLSPPSPNPNKQHLLSVSPQQLMRRPRSRTAQGDDECSEAQMKENESPAFFSASAPSSPLQSRKWPSMPVSSLTRASSPFGSRMSLRVDPDEPGSFARQLQAHLMGFDKTRESLPWNVWKTIRDPGTDKADDSSGESSGEEDEEEGIRRYQQMSGHRKTFEVWLTNKQDQIVKKHEEAEAEAKRLSEQKSLEEMQRRMRAKTFDEWLKEKEARMEKAENDCNDVTEAESESRRAQASFKYQQWMKKKDRLALEQEEKIRAEEQRKYEELKKKREELGKCTRWLRKEVGKVDSVPT